MKDAQLVAGKITIIADENNTAGPVLEMHKFLWNVKSARLPQIRDAHVMTRSAEQCVTLAATIPLVGMGPYAAAKSGDNEILQSLGAGVLFSFRNEESDKSLHLGIAYTIDLHVREPAKVFVEEQPLPSREPQTRCRVTSQPGLLILVSAGC